MATLIEEQADTEPVDSLVPDRLRQQNIEQQRRKALESESVTDLIERVARLEAAQPPPLIEEQADPESIDSLVPDPQVWRELGITAMTGWRYTNDPQLDFPPAIQIRNRNFRSRQALEAFKARMLRRALETRNTT